MSRGLVCLILSCLAWGMPAQAETMRFDVTALGFKVGAFEMSAEETATRYSVSARFGTTGLVRLFRDMGFEMRASGRRLGREFFPNDYSEEVNTGRRTSSARLHYAGGVPQLTGGAVSDGEVTPLDPATQGGTLDPLTALFTVLRDQNAETLCKADMQIFDGGRRTRVVLTGRIDTGAAVTCTGQFRRIAGYPDHDLETRGVVPLTIRYAPGDNGRMRAQSALLRTSYGPVGLRRRD